QRPFCARLSPRSTEDDSAETAACPATSVLNEVSATPQMQTPRNLDIGKYKQASRLEGWHFTIDWSIQYPTTALPPSVSTTPGLCSGLGGFMTHSTQCSRRHFMTTVAVAAGSALAPGFSLASPLQDPVIDTTEKQGKSVSREKVLWRARPFPLKQVRLGEGPCKVAMEADQRYLHSLPTDRLLHTFRINAGIPSSAQPLGGWEAPDCELRGHYAGGHYLSACA